MDLMDETIPFDKRCRLSLEYRYFDMKARCQNPNHKKYKYYGERNISMNFKDKKEFIDLYIEEFKEKAIKYGIGNIQFDRINNNGDYDKNNLRITTRSINNYNKRSSKLFKITNGANVLLSNSALKVAEIYGGNGRSLGNLIRGTSKTWSDGNKDKWWLLDVLKFENGNNFINDVKSMLYMVDRIVLEWDGDDKNYVRELLQIKRSRRIY